MQALRFSWVFDRKQRAIRMVIASQPMHRHFKHFETTLYAVGAPQRRNM
jgi:hypothetical protein